MVSKFTKNDEAVSAVIGVILMVAITVILAAVIAAFVFQLSSNVPKNKQIGVETKRVSSTVIYVKTMSGTDIGQLSVGTSTAPTYKVMSNGQPAAVCANPAPGGLTTYDGSSIGSTIYFGGVPANADITVIGNFTDNTQFPVWAGVIA